LFEVAPTTFEVAPTTSNILGDHEFSAGCYLFMVSNSGLLFSHGPPSQAMSSLADLFDRVDNHTVIDFIKEIHFYHQL